MSETRRVTPNPKQPSRDLRLSRSQDPDLLNDAVDEAFRRVDPSEHIDGPLETAIVAAGRSIDAPDETAEKAIAGYSVIDEKYVYRQPTKRYQPGDVIKLPRAEVLRLRRLGFLVDPEGAVIPTSTTGMPQ